MFNIHFLKYPKKLAMVHGNILKVILLTIYSLGRKVFSSFQIFYNVFFSCQLATFVSVCLLIEYTLFRSWYISGTVLRDKAIEMHKVFTWKSSAFNEHRQVNNHMTATEAE